MKPCFPGRCASRCLICMQQHSEFFVLFHRAAQSWKAASPTAPSRVEREDQRQKSTITGEGIEVSRWETSRETEGTKTYHKAKGTWGTASLPRMECLMTQLSA